MHSSTREYVTLAYKAFYLAVIKHPINNTYEYLLASAWSEGAVYNNKETFTAYVQKTAREYNHPLQTQFVTIQDK